jgi:hypothetical protein
VDDADSIASASAGVPVRLVPIRQLTIAGAPSGADIGALTESIRTHGIIQPLLIRQNADRYEVIAGKRRYAAAIAAGLIAVPCILHQVDDDSAAALAAAENTRAQARSGPLRAAVATQLTRGVREIADELARLDKLVLLLRTLDAGYQRDTVTDLIRAQVWSTSWLANTTAFLSTGKCPNGRRRLVPMIVDDVVEAFGIEARLSGVRFEVVHTPSRAVVDDSLVGLAIAGAIVVTLSFVREVAEPVLTVSTQAFDNGHVGVQVTQHHVSVPRELSDRFSTGTLPASSPLPVILAAMALAHATAAYGGASALICPAEGGTSIQLTFRSLEPA